MSCFNPQPTTPEKILGNRFAGRSFFEPQQFKVALDRCEGSNKSCEIHAEIFEDFVVILEKFLSSLKKWQENSVYKIHQSKEMGTNKQVFLETVRTMAKIGEAHDGLAKGIKEDVVQKMRSFREAEFGRTLIHSKKHETFKKKFNKAQKRWAELVDDTNEKWTEINAAEPGLNRARRESRYCEGDFGAEQEKKDAANKCLKKHEEKMAKLRGEYRELLKKAENSRGEYEKDMTEVLEETHKFERKRLEEFLKSFETIGKNVTEKFTISTTLADEFKSAIAKHKIEDDIKYWDEHYGSKANLPWGVFQQLKDESK